MIKIDKDLFAIPQSLIPAFNNLFLDGAIPNSSVTTHTRRTELIAAEHYIDEDVYNSRYKNSDIKEALRNIYRNKCAYCEQKVEQGHVEHYRPKRLYYWLAYSWDNLIMACPNCNQGKGMNFNLNGEAQPFDHSEASLRAINSLSANIDVIEQPLLVNPEVTNPLGLISFGQDGSITSENERFAYTIDKCKIDRNYLKDERRKILNDLKEDIQAVLVDENDPIDQEVAIRTIIKKFVRSSLDLDSQFLAFKRFAISNEWLKDIVKQMN